MYIGFRPGPEDTHHMGYVTEAIYTNFLSPFPWKLHIKFVFD